MRSIDGTDLALAVTTVSSEASSSESDDAIRSHVYILYCQGPSPHSPAVLAMALAEQRRQATPHRFLAGFKTTPGFLERSGRPSAKTTLDMARFASLKLA